MGGDIDVMLGLVSAHISASEDTNIRQHPIYNFGAEGVDVGVTVYRKNSRRDSVR